MDIKQKNIILIVVFLLVICMCYFFAISKTLEQKKQYHTLKKEQFLFQNTPRELSILKQKEVYYDSLLTKYQLNDSSIQNNLLKTINSFANANNLKVISFLEPHSIIKNNLIIKTYEFVVEGNYNSINLLIYQLEQQNHFGEIINLHFERKKNFKTGKSYLQAKILLQSFG